VCGLLTIKREHEIVREPPDIAAHLLVQTLCGNAIEAREVFIQQDSLSTDDSHLRHPGPISVIPASAQPGLGPKPGSSTWIPASAGMTFG
jgi:hypothetical protein